MVIVMMRVSWIHPILFIDTPASMGVAVLTALKFTTCILKKIKLLPAVV